MHVNQLENDRSMGMLTVGNKGVLHVKQQFTSEKNEKFILDIKDGGKLIVGNNGEAAVSDVRMTIEASGKSEIEGSLKGKVDLAVKEGSSLTLQGGTVDVESLSGSGSVAVGTAGTPGALAGGNVSMDGGQIAFDPEFAAAGDSSNASLGGLQFKSDSLDAKVIVGRNSMVSLGSKDAEWLRDEVKKYQSDGKGTWGQDVTAALALRTPQKLALNGALKVDGAWSHGGAAPDAGSAEFAGKSLLVVDAAGVGSGTALTGSGRGKLDVDGKARLLIAGGQEGQTVKISDGFSSASNSGTGWTGDNLATNTALLDAEGGAFDAKTGAYSVTLKKGDAASAFADMAGENQGLVAAMVAQPGVDENSPNAGVRFVSRALSDDRIGRTNARLATSTLEGAAQLSAVGAVQATTMSAANAGACAVAARSSMALPGRDSSRLQAVQLDSNGKVQPSGLSAGDETPSLRNGLGLWIMPLYQADNVWGMKSGEFKSGWNSSLGGLALGADWTFDNMFRLGATFNLGGGYAKSSGDFAGTDNRFNFWGVGIYGAWSHGGFGLSADAGYTANSSSLDQDLPAAMGMPRLEADVTSHAWHAGLKAEYRFSFGDLDVIPHIGVRYMNVATDKYDVESGGGTVFEVDRAMQDIWTFPLGVEFAYGIESGSGWKFTPRLDLGVVPAAGDVHARSKTRIPGVNSQADMKMQVVDYVTFDGGLGFDLAKDSFSLGVSYNLQASEHRTGHSVSATLRYEF